MSWQKCKKQIATLLKKAVMWYFIIVFVATVLVFVSYIAIYSTGSDLYFYRTNSALEKGLIFLLGAINTYSGAVLYAINPPIVAALEHSLDKSLFYGECRVKNIVKSGTLLVWQVPNFKNELHVRGFLEDGTVVEKVCSTCVLNADNVAFTLKVKEYVPVETVFHKTPKYSEICAYLYLRAALKVEYLKEKVSQILQRLSA